jgi:hypothetical protein
MYVEYKVIKIPDKTITKNYDVPSGSSHFNRQL